MVKTINNTEDNTLHTLSIQVSLNGLSFCTVNQDQQITSLVEDNFGIQLSPEQVLDKIKYSFDHHLALKENFQSVEVIYLNNLYTHVPKPLFDADQIKEYLKYNIKVLENDFIAYDELEQHDIITVYIPYANINNFFFDSFGAFTYKHASTILTNSLLSQEKHNENVSVFVNMNHKFFDIVVINKGKLVLANTHFYETKEDFLYYLLFTTEQLNLNPEDFQLVFLGDISTQSDYYDIAYKYIRNIHFGKRNKDLGLPKELEHIAPHQHYVLLSHF